MITNVLISNPENIQGSQFGLEKFQNSEKKVKPFT
jgi:hypothetical protein